MAKMPKEVMDLFKDMQASKVLATVDPSGTPNVAPKGSLSAIDEETVAFADIAGGKTRTNLEASNKVAAAAFKELAGYQVKGVFQGFQTSGPLFDQFEKMLKSMRINIQAVGTIKVEEVYSVGVADYGKKLA
jgi:hypothetical protein